MVASARRCWRVAASLLYERLAFANPLGEAAGPFGPNVSDAEALSEGLYARVAPAVGTPSALARARRRARRRALAARPAVSRRSRARASQRLLGGVGVEDELRFFDDRLTLTAGPARSTATTTGWRCRGRRAPARWRRPATSSRPAASPCAASVDALAHAARAPSVASCASRRCSSCSATAPSCCRIRCCGRRRRGRGDVGGTLAADGRPRRAPASRPSFFGRAVDDTIVYLPSSRAAAATNLGPARMLGVELRAAAAHRQLLRRAPRLRLRRRPRARRRRRPDPGPPAAAADAARRRQARAVRPSGTSSSYVDRLYRDPANDAWIPARTLHAIGASFDHKWIQLTVELRNLADLRVVQLPAAGTTVPYPLVDYFNYPLPGRAIYATLVFRK